MEILSIGEKIKRARIYKGLTLKYICENKVSVSKMSCIENGKIKIEDWIIDFVAEKLDLPVEYLKQDVGDQLRYNIENECMNSKIEEKEKIIKYNLQYAENYGYFDIAFQLRRLLFEHYIEINDSKACLINTPEYYNLLIKLNNDECRYMYYMDIGRYFCLINEYSQAINYFNLVRNSYDAKKPIDYVDLTLVICEEVYCYYMLRDYSKAYKIAKQFIELENITTKNKYKARIYGLLGILSIKLNNNEFQLYEKMSYEISENNLSLKAELKFGYGKSFFEANLEKQAYSYIKQAIDIFPKEDKSGFIKLMIKVIEILIQMNKRKKAEELTDIILNYAIDLENNRYIEQAYHFKAILVTKGKNDIMKEMYMNLSLDVLLKYGNRRQIYVRYMEIGEMYSKMKNTQEALKYFGLALKLSKNL